MIEQLGTNPSTTPPYPVTLRLLGNFQLTITHKPEIKFRTTKSRALIAYLALANGEPLLRTTLTELLWPGYVEKSARASLRQVVADIREAFAGLNLFETDYHTIQLHVDPVNFDCDVLRFEALLTSCKEHPRQPFRRCPICQNNLRQALALYKGPFLAHFPPIDSAPFEDWVQAQRQKLAQRYSQSSQLRLDTTQSQAKLYGNLPTPLTPLVGRVDELAQLAVQLHHPVYRCLTLVGPGGIGKTRLALAVGEQHAPEFSDGVWFVDLSALTPPPADQPAAPIDMVPVDMAPVDMAPVDMASDGADGARPTQLYDRLAAAMLLARGIGLHRAKRPSEQLLTYLHDKKLLFILDNFEHLSAGVGLLVELLQKAPQVRLLVTSRHRLDLQGQLLYPVSGLAWPDPALIEQLPPLKLVTHYGSLQLFLERATLNLVGLTLATESISALVAICQVVEGMPLALELSATLLERHSLESIAQLIRTNYQVLQSTFQDLSPRQRSMRAVLQSSWQLLTAHEAQTLMRCTVFRGHFSAAAAQLVAATAQAELETLVHKSLLHSSELVTPPQLYSVRYRMHELVRQFAAEQLAQQPTLAQQSRDQHAHYYLTLAASWRPDEGAETIFRAAMQADLENVEAAWEWALAGEQVNLLLPAVEGMVEFYEMSGAFYAAEALLQRSVEQVRAWLAGLMTPSVNQQADAITARAHAFDLAQSQTASTLLATLLVQLGYVRTIGLAQQAAAQAAAEEALRLGQQLENDLLIVRSYHVLSGTAYGQNQFAQGQSWGESAVAVARQAGLRREEAMALGAMGMNATAHHDHTTALSALAQALTLAQQIGDSRKALLFRNQLGITYREMGDLGQAMACFEQNLPATRAYNDDYNLAITVANLGLLYLLLGDYQAGNAALEEGYQLFQRLGEQRIMNDCLAVLGFLLLQQGNDTEAYATCHQALAHPAIQQSAQQVAWFTLGNLHLAQKDWVAAHAAYTKLAALSQEADIPGLGLLADSGVAMVLLAQGEPTKALAILDPLLPRVQVTLFDTFFSPLYFLLSAYQILAANQDLRAADLLQQAWHYLQAQAARLSDPKQRAAYLTNVPVNRQLSELVHAQS